MKKTQKMPASALTPRNKRRWSVICKTPGCRERAYDPYSRCRKHQRAYLKRIGAAPKAPAVEEVVRCTRSGHSIRRGRKRCDQCAWSQYTEPCPTPLSEVELANLLATIKETDGAEIPREQWPLAEVLVARGLITLGGARGPGGNWRRAVAVLDFAELERRTLAAGAEREPVESMSLAEKYGDTAYTGKTRRMAEAPTRSREEFLSDQQAKQVAARLRMLTPDPPIPPPVPGVESAVVFADRLARKLQIFGEPMPGLVIEILNAVRERDAAVVKQMFARAEQLVPPTRTARLAHVERELFKAVSYIREEDRDIVQRALAQAAES